MPNLYVFPDRLLDDCGQAALTKAICWPASVEPTKRRLYDGLLLPGVSHSRTCWFAFVHGLTNDAA